MSPAPIPRDPRAPKVSAEEVTERVESILAEPTEGLAAEVDALTRAHAVLHEALSDS
ncbi:MULTISPECIES: hypothetical protein [unclassified Corynebacterium]|uniref:hypothetical protein n=1 Tax=unclassified Corynebacterium TaxID=2624378 RepID=UPI001EF3EDE8|nr:MULTISPECIES: hypothetical protein [unclassified Corynebacterium]MCG7289158.1 hypothetical protein [Corynebacterium sp. ACRPZ]MCG7293228.1 hypothetical protein [Corynebacterium sp. ACRPY]